LFTWFVRHSENVSLRPTTILKQIKQQTVEIPQPPPTAEFAAENLSAENPPNKLWRAELAAEFY